MEGTTIDERGSVVPVTVLEPQRGWTGFAFREIWAYRELLFFLIWRDVKVRYKQTFFGVAWALLQPLLLVLIFSISIGRSPGIGIAEVPYPVFVLTGLVAWGIFAQGVNGAANSLIGGEALISKVYFPRLLLPIAAAASHLVDFLVSFPVLIVVMLAAGYPPTASIAAVPALITLDLLAALGVGTLLGALNVRFRDVRHAVPFLVQILFFATPVVYQLSIVPTQLQGLLGLNPMTGIVVAFQAAVLGLPLRTDLLAASTIITIAIALVAVGYFRRAERLFADVI
jgi:lipopolysaccharide transport system permease protein